MRRSGILLHISSLPSPWGIGTLGLEAYKFIDFLDASKIGVWQMLPTGPTGYGDSPYQGFSAFAGNPYFIDLDMLCEDGLLKPYEYINLNWGDSPEKVDYHMLYEHRFGVLHAAYERFIGVCGRDFDDFKQNNPGWLSDYSLFMALKGLYKGAPWYDWEENVKNRVPSAIKKLGEKLAYEIGFHEFTQYIYSRQWRKLKLYAKAHDVMLMGDMPIYAALDSADVWANAGLFLLDDLKRPISVAGVPPDYFSPDGQLWGNPLYDWPAMKDTGFLWWNKRVWRLTEQFDLIRIDHFRGFADYYSIPKGARTAAAGEWVEGPRESLFDALTDELGPLPFVAEDLGLLTPSVENLLDSTGFPGMSVLCFAFSSDSANKHLPHHACENRVMYTTTHDNEPAEAWWDCISEPERSYAARYMNMRDGEKVSMAMIRTAFSSVCGLAVAPMQDVLGLGIEARMNRPGTLGENWAWRMKAQAGPDVSERLRELNLLYGR